MQVLDLLLALPDPLVALVLTSWLKVQDVGRTDAALCCRDHRSEFHRQAFQNGLVYSTHHFINDLSGNFCRYDCDGLMCWALARSVSICTIKISEALLSAQPQRQEYLRLNGCNVRKIFFRKRGQLEWDAIGSMMEDLLKFCPTITVFYSCPELTASHYTAIATKWPKLETLQMHPTCEEESLRVVGQLCKNLKHLDGGFQQASNLRAWTKLINSIGGGLESIRGESYEQRNPWARYVIDDVAQYCPNLRSYQASGMFVFPRSLRALLKGCPQLTELHANYTFMKDEGLEVLAELGARLTSLVLSNSSGFTDERLLAMLNTCRQLRKLNLYFTEKLTDITFCAIGQYCLLMEDLDLSEQVCLTDKGVCAIAAGCPLLRCFTLGNTAITNKGLSTLLRSCPRLVDLGLDECSNLNGRGIRSIPRLRPEITDLTIVKVNVGLKSLKALAKGLKKLRYIHVSYQELEDADAKDVFNLSTIVHKSSVSYCGSYKHRWPRF